MSKKAKEAKWFENQQQITGIVTQLKKHYYDYKSLSGLYRPYPFEVDYEKLLEASEGNHKLVDAVKKYITECYFDNEGNPKEYSGIKRLLIYKYRNSEESIHQNAKDWIHVSFDKEFSVHLIAGPIGDDHVIDNFGMNKAFLYSMSKML
ncbi:hypothetical protein ACIFOE_04730 [Paenibacillus sp. NRS-1783]|uniref:hypothetical protein n=1 Tax=Paenibacillus sp. NRS-1783 TaxID=3233907 RepID=UPI003D2B8455